MELTTGMLVQLIRKNVAVSLDHSTNNARFEELHKKFNEFKVNYKTPEETIKGKAA